MLPFPVPHVLAAAAPRFDRRGLLCTAAGLGLSNAIGWSSSFWLTFGLQILIALIVIGIFVAAIILGVLAICIGLLITLPIAITLTYGIPTFAYAYTYRVLSGQPVS